MKSDDLVPFLTVQQPRDLGFRQGTVVDWDPSNGRNTINVSGTLVTDLPMINLADAPNIRPGDVVAITRFRSVYFIAGRIVNAGTTDFGSAAVAFAHATDNAFGFAVTTGGADLVTATVPVPPWANTAQYQVLVNASIFNGGTTSTNVYVAAGSAVPPDAFTYGNQSFTGAEAGMSRNVTAFTQVAGTGDIAGKTLAFAGRLHGDAALAAQPANSIALDVNVTFTRTR
ncbi:MAG: hypothetical protein J2P24_00325 [Streptosporangiales bacterium]|nr:hypothetical protein [Streptosporangiales bacterium]